VGPVDSVEIGVGVGVTDGDDAVVGIVVDVDSKDQVDGQVYYIYTYTVRAGMQYYFRFRMLENTIDS